MKIANLFRYEAFIIIGLAMAILTLLKLFGVYDISSDWFWFIAGVGLVTEGTISLFKQKTFDKKFKILSKEEYEGIINKIS